MALSTFWTTGMTSDLNWQTNFRQFNVLNIKDTCLVLARRTSPHDRWANQQWPKSPPWGRRKSHMKQTWMLGNLEHRTPILAWLRLYLTPKGAIFRKKCDGIFVFALRTQTSLVFLWHKGRNFRAITGYWRLAAPIDFIRGISAGKLDTFRLHFVSISDERGSVINDYL